MKQLFVLIFILVALSLQFCTSSRKNKANKMKTTYVGNIQPVMTANCSPCHIPPNNRKKVYDNYTAVSTDINEILKRIQKNPTEEGFMPFKHPKLPDSTINIFLKWKSDGLPER